MMFMRMKSILIAEAVVIVEAEVMAMILSPVIVVAKTKVANTTVNVMTMMTILYGLQYIISLYPQLCWKGATIR